MSAPPLPEMLRPKNTELPRILQSGSVLRCLSVLPAPPLPFLKMTSLYSFHPGIFFNVPVLDLQPVSFFLFQGIVQCVGKRNRPVFASGTPDRNDKLVFSLRHIVRNQKLYHVRQFI